MGGLVDFDHPDKNSTSGLFSTHDTATIPWQVKPVLSIIKLDKSSINLNSINSFPKIACQEIISFSSSKTPANIRNTKKLETQNSS